MIRKSKVVRHLLTKYKIIGPILCSLLVVVMVTGCTDNRKDTDRSTTTVTAQDESSSAKSTSDNTLVNSGQPKKPVQQDGSVKEQKLEAAAYLGLGDTYNRIGETDKALQAYEKAIELKPDYAEAYFGKGHVLAVQGETDRAIEAFEQAIKFRPDYAEAYYEKGTTLQIKGRFEEAIKSLDMAIGIKPDYAEAYFMKGVTLRQQNKSDEAIKVLKKAIELDSKNNNSYINLSRIYRTQKKFNEAIYIANVALKNIPEEDAADIHYEKALTYAVMGDLENSLSSLEKCIELNPNYSKIADSEEEFSDLKNTEKFKSIVGN